MEEHIQRRERRTIGDDDEGSSKMHSRGENDAKINVMRRKLTHEEFDKGMVELKEELNLVNMLLEREDQRERWNLRIRFKLFVSQKDFKKKFPKFRELGEIRVRSLRKSWMEEVEIKKTKPKEGVFHCCSLEKGPLL